MTEPTDIHLVLVHEPDADHNTQIETLVKLVDTLVCAAVDRHDACPSCTLLTIIACMAERGAMDACREPAAWFRHIHDNLDELEAMMAAKSCTPAGKRLH